MILICMNMVQVIRYVILIYCILFLPQFIYGQNLEITISPLTYYELPDSLTVISNGTLLSNGVQYLYQKSTGKFLIYGTFDCFGAITISGSGIDVSPKTQLIAWAQNYLHLSYTVSEGRCNSPYFLYYKTAKNNMVSELFGAFGFQLDTKLENGDSEWHLDINSYENKNHVIKVNEKENNYEQK